MAVPESMTVFDISGRYTMNKTLSDDTEQVLALQGVPWWKRKVIGAATVTLDVKHYKDEEGIENIDINQTLTGGISGTAELRRLDGVEREHQDDVFGFVIGCSSRTPLTELKEEWLKTGWSEDTLAHPLVYARGMSDTEKSGLTWTANQTWGFQTIEGVKRYARDVYFVTPDKEISVRLFYDYVGPVPA